MATTGAPTKTFKKITNAWVNKTLPDIFYEQMVLAEEPVVQEEVLDRVKQLLMQMFRARPDVFISGAFYICYDPTNGNRRLQPDCIIVFDVDAEAVRYNLPNYWIWEVGKPPDFVMEMASPTTADNDLGHKRDMYAELGIAEYWRFDPTGGDYYGQPLAGERLVDGEYQPYELREEEDCSVIGYSPLLDLNFYWDGDEFDVLDPVTGRTVDRLVAAENERDAAEERAEAEREARLTEEQARMAEREARLAAEARERELLAEIERLRRQSGQ